MTSFHLWVESKKRSRRPNYKIDDFLKEIDSLRHTISKMPLAQKRKKEEADRSDVDTVLRNLRQDHDIYRRLNKLKNYLGQDASQKKVSRKDAQTIAKDLGIDFTQEKFTPEAFRKALEFELNRDDDNEYRDQE